ncbi:MAG: asparagine synthase (glutamine-hydrolyzing) [Chloroflexota bacterium]
MCGIFGQLNFRPEGIPTDYLPSSYLSSALEAIHHRGPDESGSWENQIVSLGMCRLSIIDLSGGQQPIWNEDQTCCIVYNGELYNFLDLRPQLEAKGHCFKTRSDTEVVLHAYEEWGVECLHRFNGMFALAIWDERTQTLFLARDRIGEKPLYYYKQGNQRLVFASEIKAILTDPTIPREVDPGGLSNFLTFGHSMAPKTIYRHLLKLLPGHYLLASNGEVRIKQYWDVCLGPSVPCNGIYTERDYAAQILDLFNDSVGRRMVADVPVGAFLSGGVDSSAVVALMKNHTDAPIKTFSLGFDTGKANFGKTYNELSDARKVADYFGTEHHELQVGHMDLVETLRTLVYHYDEPFGDPAGFPVYLLSQYAQEQVKVVLTGDGGDELFGGYLRYAIDQLARYYQHLPDPVIHSWIPALASRLPRSRRLKQLTQTLPIVQPALRYAKWLTLFSPEMQAELLNPEINKMAADHDPTMYFSHHYAHFGEHRNQDHLNQLMYVDFKTWLVDVYMEKTDKATMARSLEARLPLLDHRLVELAFQLPSRHKIRRWETKHIFKKSIQSIVPEFVLKKPKHGFSVPTDPWFRGDLKEYAYEVLLDPSVERHGYFNMQFVEKLWREHANGYHAWDAQLWLLLNFELWHRLYIDAA